MTSYFKIVVPKLDDFGLANVIKSK